MFPLSRICTFTTLLRSFTSTYRTKTMSNLSGMYYTYNRNTDAGCVSNFDRLRVIVTQHKNNIRVMLVLSRMPSLAMYDARVDNP